MSGVRDVPMLRHPTLGVPMPWLDTRPVPKATLCEYLGADYARVDSLIRSGCFSERGCTQQVGDTRPVMYFVPARIWAANGWTPGPEVLAMLSQRTPTEALRTLADQLGAMQSALAAVAGTPGKVGAA